MQYQNIITIEPGRRGGKPCIRGMRITVYDGDLELALDEDWLPEASDI
ncbi:hypothetical protein NSTC745_00312 [Nostoc sp. DSM 114161]